MRTEKQQIVLDRVRIALNLLRKCEVVASDGNQQREHPILSKFKELQSIVRYSSLENELEATPIDIISPFLMVIRAKNISGPFKLMCLESLQTFVQAGACLSDVNESSTAALSELIDAVTKCKFIQTDSAGDDLVQLYLLQTLHKVVTSPSSLVLLSTEAGKNLLDFCLLTLLRTGGVRRAAMLHQEAEHVVVDYFRLMQRRVVEDGRNHNNSNSIGLTCLLRATNYLVNVIRSASSDSGSASNSESNSQASSSSITTTGQSTVTTIGVEWIHDSDLMHLIFALKTLNHFLSGWGDVSLAREMIMRYPEFYSCVMDQLCSQLLMLCSRRDRFPPIVLQLSLTLFSTLVNSFAVCAKVIVECFMKQIYIKALIQSLETFTQTISNPLPEDNNSTLSAPSPPNSFRPDELEIVLESLLDLLSASSFLPSLFLSFDCDPVKSDIAQPLIHYICLCSQKILTSGSDELGSLREVGVLIVQAYKQVDRGLLSRQASSDLFFSSKSAEKEKEQSTSSSCPSPLSDLLIAARRTKQILSQASTLFEQKPELGFKFLQQSNVLPVPLTVSSVATFLRVAPGLSKEHVGGFLGELGKDSPKHEWDGKAFHVEVLLKYVESFSLGGQSVLTCLRIFLSAFRLPGEAQQIDRILVAFSEYCHANCIEGRSGLIENPEITYLLTFSIIMLNTDRHNPNIRDDRRMTLEQFIRNNTNYGKDVNQTVPLPRDFLEQIYNSISEFPIRTERNDISATITQEMWMDLQLQSEADYKKTILVSTEHPSAFLSAFASLHNSSSELELGDIQSVKKYLPTEITNFLLTSQSGYHLEVNPLQLSSLLTGLHWVCDKDLLDCVWHEMMHTSCSVYFNNFKNMKNRLHMESQQITYNNNIDNNNKKRLRSRERISRPFQVSHEFLCDLIKLSCYYGLDHILETVIVLLVEFTGATDLKINASEKVLNLLENYHINKRVNDNIFNELDTISFVACGEFLYRITNFSSARLSLLNLLQVIQSNQSHIKHWSIIWKFFSLLRDCALLPVKMVSDSETDFLPLSVRQDFENKLITSDRIRIQRNQHLLAKPKKLKSTSSSFLSFQGIGEALFGTGEETEDEQQQHSSSSRSFPLQVDVSSPLSAFNLPSARWDVGYDFAQTSTTIITTTGEAMTTASVEEKVSSGQANQVYSIEDIRKQISETNVQQVISDTKFIPEKGLVNCITSLLALVTDEQQEDAKKESTDSSNGSSEVEVTDVLVSLSRRISSSSRSRVNNNNNNNNISSVSGSSIAWLEMVLVDIALRNRDRFAAIWSLLKQHYSLTLRGNNNNNSSELTYVTERRVIGLLRISSRMISREQFAADILELLGELFIDHAGVKAELGNNNNNNNNNSEEIVTEPVEKDVKSLKPSSLLLDLSDQISAGIWTLLTLNVDLLPVLPLEQWQTLFRIIAVTASSSSSFACIKSFEVMAWLLHEPRLVAKVPVFCIIGVKPLLLNQQAPLSVSVGAIHLLTHLHSRLEVLIKEDDNSNNVFDEDYISDSDTPILWESCWIPILKTLSEGATDSRESVRISCVQSLCSAIVDKHSSAVPAGVLVDILGDIVSPVVTLLGSFVWEEASKITQQQIQQQQQQQHQETTNNNDQTIQPHHHVSVAEQSLAALCQVFLLQIQKLAIYPSFDKLWLRILYVLGYFIGSRSNSYGIDSNLLDLIEKQADINNNNNNNNSIATFQILISLKNTAKEKLLVLLTTLISEGIFELRDGLWFVTRETISQMRNGDELISSLSPVVIVAGSSS